MMAETQAGSFRFQNGGGWKTSVTDFRLRSNLFRLKLDRVDVD